MGNWKRLLGPATAARTLKRARSCVGKGVHYKLGKGGFDPTKPMKEQCDCSGFVAWAIGIPRELPPGSGKWLQTTSYWQGGGPAGQGLFDTVDEVRAVTGDLIVYPDRGGKQGHMGIVGAVEGGAVKAVIHCSSGNDRRLGDAIQETSPSVFRTNAKTQIKRVDYAALRDLFNVRETQENEAVVDVPHPTARLAHPLLAGDETLAQVARGTLVLEATGSPVAGCAALHDAMNRLAANEPHYRIPLGGNNRFRGYYGPKTEAALKEFQKDHQIPSTGELDADTAIALDSALLALEANPPGVRTT